MNWDLFSMTGYASIAIWLCMPLLWSLHWLMGRRGWLLHVALVLGLASFVLAKLNSTNYVARIQVDRSEQIQQQLDRQEIAQRAATEARESEVAQIRFAEDAANDFLDSAGMDEADLKYLQSFQDESTEETVVPQWKTEKKQRSTETADDSLESQIGAKESQQGVDTAPVVENEPVPPILMSGSDKLAADRFDKANLMMIRVMLCLATVVLLVDYLRRANDYQLAYFPMPLPSRWVDSFAPLDPVIVRSKSPRRSLLDELRVFVRRGDSFVYITEDVTAAAEAVTTLGRLPFGRWPIEVLNVDDFSCDMDDDFVFDTLWFGRNAFVVNSSDRAELMLARFMELMAERKSTRARVKQTVHVVWDVTLPITEETRCRFANLGRATGYSLLICRESTEAMLAQDCKPA